MHALDDGPAPLLGQDMSSVVVTRRWGSAGQAGSAGSVLAGTHALGGDPATRRVH